MSLSPIEYLRHVLDETRYLTEWYDIVWDVVVNKVPTLRNKIEQILHEESKGSTHSQATL